MKRIFSFLSIAVFLYACKPGIPKNIIQPQKMENILFDIHVVDGYMTSMPSPDTAKKVSAAYYKGIYKKFGIDSALYNKSLNYYYDHPDVMNKMYENITKKLNATKEKLNSAEMKKTAEEVKVK